MLLFIIIIIAVVLCAAIAKAWHELKLEDEADDKNSQYPPDPFE